MKPRNLVSKAIFIFLDYFLLFLKDAIPGRYFKIERTSASYRKLNISIFFLFLGLNLFSQDYNIKDYNGQTVSTCSGVFYDSGGPTGEYENNKDYTVTFCSLSGENLRFNFTNVDIRSGDVLSVYDGPNTSSALVGSYTGGIIADFSITSSGTCLTFNFKSNPLFNRPGWAANISCVSCPPAVTSPILPSASEVCAGTTINYSVDDHPGSTYNWIVHYGTPTRVTGGTNNLDVTWDLPGGVTGIVSVEEVPACGLSDSSKLYVDIYPLPIVDFSGLNSDYCLDDAPVTLTGSPTGGVFSGPGISGNTFTPSSAGVGTHNIIYSYTDPSTSCSNQKTIQTTVSKPAIFNVAASSNSYCSGSTGVDITLSGSETGVNYQLKVDGSDDGDPVSGTGSSLTWNNKTAGTYSVVASIAAFTCTETMSGSPVITIDPLPASYNVGASSNAYCSGPGVTITLSGSETGVNYQLKHDGIDEDAPVAGTGSSLTWDNKTFGVYTVVATNTTTSCTNNMAGSQAIILGTSPTPSISGNNSVCPNAAGVIYSTPLVPGNTYNWTVTGGTLIGSGNSIQVNWGAAGPGTVAVTETVTLTGCSYTTPDYIVQIGDAIAPVISDCPANIVISSDPSLCSAAVSWSEPTAIDNCGGAMTYTTRSNAPGSNFNQGVTTVSYTFTDISGNTSTCSFTITVNESEPPVALCKNISVILDAFGAATITAAQVDNGSTDNCGIASASVAPNTFNSSNIGPNNVTLTITDNSGNISTCIAVVTVIDNNPPVAICKNITVSLNSAGTVSINGADIDNGSNDPDGIASLSVSPDNFSCIDIGPNNVILTVTDNAGKSSTCTSVVTVADNTLPVITCPGNWNTFTDPGVCGAVVNYATPVGIDNCSGSTTSQTTGFASGSVFPVGTTTNTFLVTDGSGNTATCSFTVTVTDNEGPVITLPTPPVINSGAGCQAAIPPIAATFSDNCTPLGSIVVTQTPAAGTMVGLGITTVTLTATDIAGNSSSSDIDVTVLDAAKPVITTPANKTQNLDNNCQALVPDFLASLTVSDNCTVPGAMTKTQTPAAGSIITGAASTNILIEATDESGNKESVTVLFITQDVTPPVVLCKDVNLYLDGSGTGILNASAVNNGSTDNCTSVLNFSLNRTAFSCSDIGTPVSVTLTGTDASSNSSTCTSLVTVLDTVKPVVNVKTFNLVLGPTGTGALLPSDVDNGSFDNCGSVTLSVSPSTFNCGDMGTRTVILTALDSHGNSRSKSVQITVSSTLKIDAMSLSSCDLASPFASYKASVSGGSGSYTYLWGVIEAGAYPFVYFNGIFPFIHFSNTSTSATPFFNNLMPDGVYNIRLTVTDGNGCTATSQFVLNKSGFAFNNVTKVNSNACDGDTKIYNVTVSSGATYSWNVTNGTFLSPTNTNTVTVRWDVGATSGLVVGTVTKTDLMGNTCGSSVENTVTINALPTPVFSVEPLSVCSGSVSTYSLSSTYSSHSWSVTGGNITGGGASTDNYVTVTWGSGPTGNVSVTVTNGSGCTGATSTAVTINSLPVPTLSSSEADNTFCAGTSVTFTAIGGNNYNFRVNGSSVQNGASATYTTSSFTNGQVVDVIVTNINGCSATSAGITNTVIAYPTATLVSSDADNTFCLGTTVVFTASGGTNFDFRIDGISVQNSGAPIYTTSTLTNGQVVDVIVSNASGCSTTSAGIANTVVALPVPGLVSSDADNSFCAGTSVTFTASGGTTYNFRINGVSIQSGLSPSFTTTALTNGQVVDVVVTNASSCSAQSAGITNTVFALPSATISSSDADNVICDGSSVTFTAGGGTNYEFRVNGTIVQNSSSATYTTTSLTNGQIVDVIITNASGCTSTSAGIKTTVTPLPTAIISYVGSSWCTTAGVQNVTLTGTGAYTGGTYSATPAGLTIDIATGAITPGTSTAGNYTVTYTTIPVGGCGSITASANVTVSPDNTIILSSGAGTNNQTLCINSAMTVITFATTGATGATVTGLPAGVTGSWTGNLVTIGGTPTASGSFPYTVTLTGGCGTVTSTGTIIVSPKNAITLTSAGGTDSQTKCINTAITDIKYATTGATGATFNGLPLGVSGVWASNVVTISGTPTVSGTYNYTITLTGGCGIVAVNGVITVTPVNTILLTSAVGTNAQTKCINTPLTTITYSTTGAISATVTGLPSGVTGNWLSNSITISGTPTVSGIFNYLVTLNGGCGTVTTNGTITVNPDAAISLNSASGTDAQTKCINTAITNITYSVTGGGTGAGVTGLPAGVTGTYNAGVFTINGTPSASGTFNYTVTSTGTCALAIVTGKITVTPDNTIALSSGAGTNNQTLCINTAMPSITFTTTGATGATVTGLPSGVTGSWAGNVVTISGTPTASGSFPYTATLTGGCGTVTSTGIITVMPDNTIALSSGAGTNNQTFCINTAMTSITFTTTGATGATVTGLPSGVSGSWAGNVVTISGTPTTSGSFPYTVTLTGGCGTVTSSGIITVTSDNTITLSSGAGTNNQTLCINTAMTDITFASTGATGATITGLPAGVIGSWAGNVVTITGTPTVSGSFPYTVTLTGGCGNVTSTGTITVAVASVGGTVTGGTSICAGSTSAIMTLTGYTGTVTKWQSSPDGTTWTDIINTADTYISGVLVSTTQFRAVVQNGACLEATSSSTTVTVDDFIAPVPDLATLPDITAECSITALVQPTATDNCTGTVTVTSDAALPITKQGTTIVTWTYDDGNGNIATQTQNVVITDITDPVPDLTTLPDVTADCSVTALMQPTATDNCAGMVTVTSDAVLPITTQGTTVVKWTYDDGNGNTTIQTQNVIISDNSSPVVAGSLTEATIEGCTLSVAPAAVTSVAELEALPGGITITDACTNDVALMVTSSDVSTGTCPLVITRTYTVTDAHGNSVNVSQTINIADTTAPVINGCPVDITVNNNPGSCGALVTWTLPTVTDNCGLLSVVSSHNSGEFFTTGTTPVSYTATDNCGKITTCSFNVVVIDNESPAITCPANISQIEDAGFSYTTIKVPDATITDNCVVNTLTWVMTGATTAVSPATGVNQVGTYVFNTGVTTVSYIVYDAAGNSAICNFTVTVTPPLALTGSITSQTNVSCFGTATGSFTIEGSGGYAPYEYSLDATTYQSSGIFGLLAAGDYTITIRDATLKTSDVSVTITQPLSVVGGEVVSQTNILCYGSNTGKVTVNGSGGTPPYSYKLGSGSYQVSGTFESLVAGTYLITVQDANLCPFDMTVTISQPTAALTGRVVAKNNASCSGSANGSVSVLGDGGTYPYEYSLNGGAYQTSGVFGNLGAGTHIITVRDANNCVINVSEVITEPPVLSIAHTVEDASCPGEADGSITLTITGGTNPYNVIWSDGIVTPNRKNIPDGAYSVIVTDKNGCAASLNIVVGFVGSENCLEVSEIITPNNDGFNDTWKIKNIGLFPNAEVLVFNRWGKLVFKTKNISANEWDGTFKGKLLPTDSYHYVLHLNNGSEPRSGVISIIR
ncbi:MAG: HYR domain-containing protein [Bacteroidales bacterium]|nr:HYR domain-containing protein [Bacteroidales bacterium]